MGPEFGRSLLKMFSLLLLMTPLALPRIPLERQLPMEMTWMPVERQMPLERQLPVKSRQDGSEMVSGYGLSKGATAMERAGKSNPYKSHLTLGSRGDKYYSEKSVRAQLADLWKPGK